MTRPQPSASTPDRFPAPPAECREQPVNCRRCGAVRTMHRTAECSSCGRWAPPISVELVRPGDWICAGMAMTGREWAKVTGVRIGPGWVLLETGELGAFRVYSRFDEVPYRPAETWVAA